MHPLPPPHRPPSPIPCPPCPSTPMGSYQFVADTPTDPGCYTRQPNGCPGKMDPTTVWTRDTWGEANANSGSSQSACEGRKSGHDGWCGNSDSEWTFVPGLILSSLAPSLAPSLPRSLPPRHPPSLPRSLPRGRFINPYIEVERQCLLRLLFESP